MKKIRTTVSCCERIVTEDMTLSNGYSVNTLAVGAAEGEAGWGIHWSLSGPSWMDSDLSGSSWMDRDSPVMSGHFLSTSGVISVPSGDEARCQVARIQDGLAKMTAVLPGNRGLIPKVSVGECPWCLEYDWNCIEEIAEYADGTILRTYASDLMADGSWLVGWTRVRGTPGPTSIVCDLISDIERSVTFDSLDRAREFIRDLQVHLGAMLAAVQCRLSPERNPRRRLSLS